MWRKASGVYNGEEVKSMKAAANGSKAEMSAASS
jgi:hypothetical protein